MLTKRSQQVLFVAALLATVCAAAACSLVGGRSSCNDCPTFKYFRLETWEFCQAMNPIVDGIEKDYADKFNFVFIEMHTPEGKAEAREEGVMGTPTFLLLDSSGERVYMLQGVHPRAVLAQHLDEVLSQE